MKALFSMVLVMCAVILGGCSKDNDNNNNAIPQSLSEGDAIVLSSPSPMGFGYFRVTGVNEGQWAAEETNTISPAFSTATFTYSVSDEKTASLFSTNTQISSSGVRKWNIRLNLVFEEPDRGTYELREVALSSGASHQCGGAFWMK